MSRVINGVLLVAMLGACGGSAKPADPPSPSDVTVRIVNHDLRDAVVFLVVANTMHQIGFAKGREATVLTIPWRRVEGAADVRLLAQQMPGPAPVEGWRVQRALTETLRLTQGGLVIWTLATNMVTVSLSYL